MVLTIFVEFGGDVLDADGEGDVDFFRRGFVVTEEPPCAVGDDEDD